ncbi:MAG: LemA family protein [Luteolibacter sp.]
MFAAGIILAVIVAVGAIALWYVIATYNGLVRMRNVFGNAFAQIDVQLKRRHDLIPNLVEAAKAYLSHERGTLEAVVAARHAAESARSAAAATPGARPEMEKLAAAEGALGGTLGRLFAVMEAYPDLKANSTITRLMEELTSTENRVSFARQAYNDAVMGYNIRREIFPANIIASSFQFHSATLFEITKPEEKEAPVVRF